jgi:hypothetical protein
MIGRKAGKYHDSEGKVMCVDQSVSSWRAQLIMETRSENENCTEEEALSLLFPQTGRKSRENKRQLFATQTLHLLNNLNLLWPADSMKLEIESSKGLSDASYRQDLISWENNFISFCLDNCGNADMNVRAAEETLEAGKMKGMDLASYIKTFRTASENCRRCKSTFSEKRIVEIFIRNLNQDADAFFRFSSKILDSSDPLYRLNSSSLEAAISHIEHFHKTVIIPELANKKRREGLSGSFKNLSDLRSYVASNVGKDVGQVSVPVTILATMINNNNNNNNNNKRILDLNVKKRKAETTKEETLKKNTKSRICYKFREQGKCTFGDKCYFSHA